MERLENPLTLARAMQLAITAVAALLLLPVTPSAASGGTDYYFPGVDIEDLRGRDVPQTCFFRAWYPGGPFAYSETVPTGSGNNPETWVSYWPAKFKLPEGSRLVIRGKYAHNRYLGFDTYAEASPIGALAGYQIEPDPGSTNTYREGENRNARRRNYTIYVVDEIEPDDPAPNTLYVRSKNPDISVFKDHSEFRYRSYFPDRGRDISGDVGLPRLARLELADGTVIRGERDICRRINLHNTTGDLTETALPTEAWNQFITLGAQLGNPRAPAQPVPRWERFFNPAHTLFGQFLLPNAQAARDQIPANTTGAGGGSLAGTQANAYMGLFLSHDGVDREIAVTTVKLPVTPETFDGDRFGHKAPIQAQYWSMCTNVDVAGYGLNAENHPTGVRQGMCHNDETVVLNSERFTRIVHSQPGSRPWNATNECGWSWLSSGQDDNLGRPVVQVLLRPNLSPEPDFAEASANVTEPYTEAEVMGDYYAQTTYMSRAEFEALGCDPDGFEQPEGRPDLPAPIWGTETTVKPAIVRSKHEPGTPVPQDPAASPVQNFFILLQYMASLLE